MNFITIDKKDWAPGVDQSRKTYRVYGPVKDENGCQIKPLATGYATGNGCPCHGHVCQIRAVSPDRKILTATLDESEDDHHVMKPVEPDDMPRVVLGIRPYDAKAVQLVKLNLTIRIIKILTGVRRMMPPPLWA